MTAATGPTRAQVALAATKSLASYQLRPPGFVPRPHQVPPPGDWYGWVLNAGRGAGKTRTCAQYIIDHVKGPPCLPGPTPHWIGIIAPTLGDAVTACVNGPSGIGTHDPTAKLSGGAGGLFVKWSNGSRAKLFGASSQEDVERLRAGGNTCLTANTLIETAHGPVRIADIHVGDYVWTRSGLRRVLRSGQTGTKLVWQLKTAAGNVVMATPSHKFWIDGRGWTELQSISPGDTLLTWNKELSHTMDSSGRSVVTGTTTLENSETHFTSTSGNANEVQFQTVITFITNLMMIEQLPISLVLKCYHHVSTGEFTSDHEVDKLRGKIANILTFPAKFVERRGDLTEYAQHARVVDLNALKNLLIEKAGPHAPVSSGCVRCVVENLSLRLVLPHEHAQLDVEQLLWRSRELNDTDDDVSLKIEFAPYVEVNFTSTVTDPPQLAQDRVVSVLATSEKHDVYNLMIEHDHEFIASNIIVMNCCVWAEELAAWRYLQECYEQMRFGLRTGPRPRWIASTTPKPKPLIKKLVKNTPHNVVVTYATTHDNPHLEQHIRDSLFEEYADRDIGRQELYAAIMEQDESALWRRDDLEQFRVVEAPSLAKISVGVDPSGGAGEQGIVVVGKHTFDVMTSKGRQRKFEGFVLDDRTCHLGPAGWGRRAVQAAVDWDADDIVVETNFGGQMAVVTIRDAAEAMGVSIPVKEVHASRGKRVRAEPVAALSSRGQWHHVGLFEQLEDQLCTWHEDLGYSPDRLDAMVWVPWHQRIVSTRPRGLGSMPTGGSMTRAIG
jgi:phage terminase large subunit-like protein